MVLVYRISPVLNTGFATQRLGIKIMGSKLADSWLKYLHFDTWDSILYSRIYLHNLLPVYNYQNDHNLNNDNNETM